MFPRLRATVLALLMVCQALLTPGAPLTAQQARPPRPQPLGKGVVLERDAASGEIRSAGTEPSTAVNSGTIRSRVTLVQVACVVTAPDGTQVRGLAQQDFRLYEDGVAQEITSFDAAATPAGIALVVDASPSIYRELTQMREAARALAANLAPADEIAVVSFSEEARILLPFSKNRVLLDRVLESKNLTRVEDSSRSNIYQTVFFTARELFRERTGRKAIVLLTDGQDSSMNLTWDPASASPFSGPAGSRLAFDDVARQLGADGIDLFIVSTEPRPRALTDAWLTTHRGEMLVSRAAQDQEIPHYTLYLAEMARRAGGQLYFLREIGNLSEIYRRIALTISAQYSLGFYPSGGTARPGWRSLRVSLIDDARLPAGAQVTHRGSYYVSAQR